jgi:hypothetical protein
MRRLRVARGKSSSRPGLGSEDGTVPKHGGTRMKRLLACTAAAVAVTSGTLALSVQPAQADDGDGSCVWSYADGNIEYAEGLTVREDWGVEWRNGRLVRRYRIWRCVAGTWVYERSEYVEGWDNPDHGDHGPVLT